MVYYGLTTLFRHNRSARYPSTIGNDVLIDSLRPSDAYGDIALVQNAFDSGLLPDGPKSLLEPMLTSH